MDVQMRLNDEQAHGLYTGYLHLRMIGWVVDSIDKLYPHFFADADFAGHIDTQ